MQIKADFFVGLSPEMPTPARAPSARPLPAGPVPAASVPIHDSTATPPATEQEAEEASEELGKKSPLREEEDREASALSPEILDAPLHNAASLVSNPAKIAGIKAWSLETIGHRGGVLGNFFGHHAGAAVGRLSPSGKLFATGGFDGVIRFVNPRNGALSRMLINPEVDINTLSWSPGSRFLVVGTALGSLRLWDVREGRLLHTQPLPSKNAILDAAWSPDGHSLALCRAAEASITLHDMPSAKQQAELRPEGDAHTVLHLSWCPDKKRLAAVSDDHKVRVWDVPAGKVLHTLDLFVEGEYPRQSAAWSPDGRVIATQYGCLIKFWDADTYQPLRAVKVHSTGEGLFWSPDGDRLVVSTINGGIVLDARSGDRTENNLRCPFQGSVREYAGCGWIEKSKMVVALSDGNLFGWDCASESASWRSATVPGAWQVCVSPDGKFYATAHGFGTRIWECASGKPTSVISGFGGWRGGIAWTTDGRLSVTNGYSVRVYNLRMEKPVQEFTPPMSESIECLGWSPDEKWLAVGMSYSGLCAWDGTTGGKIRNICKGPCQVGHLAWSPDGKQIAATFYKYQYAAEPFVFNPDEVILFDVTTGKHVQKLKGQVISTAWWLNDGRLVTGDWSGVIWQWDVKNGQRLGEPFQLGFNLPCGIVRPDSHDVFLGSMGGLYLWNADTRQSRPLLPHSEFHSVGCSRDGSVIVGVACDRVAVCDGVRCRSVTSQLIWDDENVYVTIPNDGQWTGPAEVEKKLIYVILREDGRQKMVRPDQFPGRKSREKKAEVDSASPPRDRAA
jgi:WD40 repeat protein